MLAPPQADHADHAASQFLPHGYCYLWDTSLLTLHVSSDLLIGISYVAISLALASLVHRARHDIPFSTVFVAFGLFIITCGFTHFIEVWTLWRPVYWFAGAVKALTAAASVTTAVAMPFTVPRVLGTIRDARLSRERELAAARADALAVQNALLQQQTRELEAERETARSLAAVLEQTNERLRSALTEAEAERTRADAERARAEAAAVEAERAQATAEEANRAKSGFLATMSHELRTPLNAVGGYVELLELGLRGPVNAEQRDDLRRIKRAQQHLLRLITDILDFARIEAGRVEYRRDTVPLAPLAEEVVGLIAPQAAQRAQTLVCDVSPELSAEGDHEKIAQVLLNLLSNAHKYAHPDSQIRIDARRDGRWVLLSVTDDGPGIPLERQQVIFEPFMQGMGGLTRPHQGTGLGLAISRDLARGMGGALTLKSAPGKGATFTLWLRAAEGHEA